MPIHKNHLFLKVVHWCFWLAIQSYSRLNMYFHSFTITHHFLAIKISLLIHMPLHYGILQNASRKCSIDDSKTATDETSTDNVYIFYVLGTKNSNCAAIAFYCIFITRNLFFCESMRCVLWNEILCDDYCVYNHTIPIIKALYDVPRW